MKLVVIGGGYAAICFIEEIRKIEPKETPFEITLFSVEDFCSRPNLFFRFKFPTKSDIEYGNKNDNFYQNLKIKLIKELVTNVNPKEKYLITEKEKYEFDKIVFATGSIPNYIKLEKNQFLQPSFEEYISFKTHKDIFLVRDLKDVSSIHKRIESFENGENIIIYGSGALSVDILSNLFEGYIKDKSPKFHITIITRRKVVGIPLLDEDGADILTKRILKYSNHISIIQDSVESIEYDNDHVSLLITKSNKIKCNIIIQALGVHSNTNNNFGVKINKGYVVNERFECQGEDLPPNTVFAIGDCAEIPKKNGRVVYLNWNMAREEGVECAKSIMNEKHLPNLIFSQTLRLFSFYVACLGEYHENEKLVVKSRKEENEYIKLVFEKVENKYQLVGGLVMGDLLGHYQLGTKILNFIKSKQLVEENQLDYMTKMDFPWTGDKPVKKFVNPIKKK